jgi:hypothetical protein
MTIDTAKPYSTEKVAAGRPRVDLPQTDAQESPRNRDLIAAGAMTFLQRRELRLATYATRLLIAEHSAADPGRAAGSRQSRRLWKGRQLNRTSRMTSTDRTDPSG